MSNMLNIGLAADQPLSQPRIFVIGVGGAGGNAVNNMIRSKLAGCEFAVANTDAQAMEQNLAEHKIQLGSGITRGLGAGARPDIGRAAAEESIQELMALLDGSNMVFITAGMGGGTGTGAAPVIARAARDAGILTVGVVTKPFSFEGNNRMRMAEAGIQQLQEYVDTLIVIPNQNLFRVANEKTTFADAFKMADNVLYSGVRGVTDLMIHPGVVNLDFNDIRSVMAEMGKAMMGTGEAEGENRARDAAAAAISNPLLDDVSLQGARGVLINITGGNDISLYEVDEAASKIREQVDPDANIIFGAALDESMEGRMRVSVVATGIDLAVPQHRPAVPDLSQIHDRMEPPPRVAAATNPAMAASRFGKPPAARPATQPRFTPLSGGKELGSANPQTHAAPMAPAAEPVAAARVRSEEAAVSFAEDAGIVTAMDPRERAGHHAPATRPVERRPELRGDLDDDTMLSADEAFIAPRPVNPGPKPQVVREAPPMVAGPLAIAGGGHGPGEDDDLVAPQRRAPTIFERITGAGRSRRLETVADEPQPRRTAAQPERGVSQLIDDGALDIPAFLRRQAN